MSEHKTPAPGSGYEDLTHRLPKEEPPRGTLSFAMYGLMSGWKAVVVAVSLEEHGEGALMHHLSVSRSLLGVQQRIGKFPADVQHALEAFGMHRARWRMRPPCYGFAPQPRSLCHNCLLDEKAANDADLAREWAHLMGF